MVFFYGNEFQLSYPLWFNNPGWRKGGVGVVVEFVCGWRWRKYKIELIPNNSGKLILQFKSTNPEKQKLWRCYKQVSFNRRKIRKKTICTGMTARLCLKPRLMPGKDINWFLRLGEEIFLISLKVV